MKELLSTKEVAKFLDINEKMVYSLISDKGLPGTKITGKWLFPRHLVEQWIDFHTVNYPEPATHLPPYHGLLIISGSNDPLLDRAISLFNRLHPEHLAVFGNLGSLGGIRAMKRGLCHVASSHLVQGDGDEYNFDFAGEVLDRMPAVVNFCHREQGILVQKDNPKNIEAVSDFSQPGLSIVNRPPGTGTRLLFDRELAAAGVNAEQIEGYQIEISSHLDVGLEILSGRADAAPGIRSIASMLNLGFIPLRWERYDLIVAKERFFDQGIQMFVGMLHEKEFRELAGRFDGYNLENSGKMVFPQK